MPVPIIPLVAIATMLGSAGALAWYKGLSPEDRERADQRASELAEQLFAKALDQLSRRQARQVNDQVKGEFSQS